MSRQDIVSDSSDDAREALAKSVDDVWDELHDSSSTSSQETVDSTIVIAPESPKQVTLQHGNITGSTFDLFRAAAIDDDDDDDDDSFGVESLQVSPPLAFGTEQKRSKKRSDFENGAKRQKRTKSIGIDLSSQERLSSLTSNATTTALSNKESEESSSMRDSARLKRKSKEKKRRKKRRKERKKRRLKKACKEKKRGGDSDEPDASQCKLTAKTKASARWAKQSKKPSDVDEQQRQAAADARLPTLRARTNSHGRTWVFGRGYPLELREKVYSELLERARAVGDAKRIRDPALKHYTLTSIAQRCRISLGALSNMKKKFVDERRADFDLEVAGVCSLESLDVLKPGRPGPTFGSVHKTRLKCTRQPLHSSSDSEADAEYTAALLKRARASRRRVRQRERGLKDSSSTSSSDESRASQSKDDVKEKKNEEKKKSSSSGSSSDLLSDGSGKDVSVPRRHFAPHVKVGPQADASALNLSAVVEASPLRRSSNQFFYGARVDPLLSTRVARPTESTAAINLLFGVPQAQVTEPLSGHAACEPTAAPPARAAAHISLPANDESEELIVVDSDESQQRNIGATSKGLMDLSELSDGDDLLQQLQAMTTFQKPISSGRGKPEKEKNKVVSGKEKKKQVKEESSDVDESDESDDSEDEALLERLQAFAAFQKPVSSDKRKPEKEKKKEESNKVASSKEKKKQVILESSDADESDESDYSEDAALLQRLQAMTALPKPSGKEENKRNESGKDRVDSVATSSKKVASIDVESSDDDEQDVKVANKRQHPFKSRKSRKRLRSDSVEAASPKAQAQSKRQRKGTQEKLAAKETGDSKEGDSKAKKKRRVSKSMERAAPSPKSSKRERRDSISSKHSGPSPKASNPSKRVRRNDSMRRKRGRNGNEFVSTIKRARR
jgi:hypothetical protein